MRAVWIAQNLSIGWIALDFLISTAAAKIRPQQLRELTEKALQSRLGELRKELATLRVLQVNAAAPAKLAQIKRVRKNIARALTVYNQKQKAAAREKLASAQYKPKDIRAKKTRAIRRRLTKEQIHAKAPRQKKRLQNFPKRVYYLKPIEA